MLLQCPVKCWTPFRTFLTDIVILQPWSLSALESGGVWCRTPVPDSGAGLWCQTPVSDSSVGLRCPNSGRTLCWTSVWIPVSDFRGGLQCQAPVPDSIVRLDYHWMTQLSLCPNYHLGVTIDTQVCRVCRTPVADSGGGLWPRTPVTDSSPAGT